ncbi:MAG: Rpn family recombination-promoting nuclease/putative transposase [Methanomicrobiales archaeon]|nr:Rpn family recombination-promoting nuclease/putative transposase [Methanomicrobiales archaeon]
MDIEGIEDEHFLSAQNDFMFKRIFGNTDTQLPLCSLLSAVLDVRVVSASVQNPIFPRQIDTDKESVLDIRAILDNGSHVNVEMQVYYRDHFMKRTQYYLSKLYHSQIGKGGVYDDLKRAIVINILCEGRTKFPAEYWHNVYVFKEKRRNDQMPDGMMELHFIELEKLRKSSHLDEANTLTLWGMFMNAQSTSEMKIIAKRDPAICKAYTIVEEVARNKEERERYHAREAFLRDQISNEEAARKKGVVEGRAEGRVEAARKMVAAGMDPVEVCNAIGISVSDLD